MDPTPTPAKNSAPPEGTPQPALASALGLTSDALKKIRDEALTPGEHWRPGRPHVYTPAGIEKIRAFLGLPAAPGADARTGPLRATLTVLRPAKGCTHIVLCTHAGQPVNLKVKAGHNHLFTPGLQVPNCAQHPSAPSLFTFEGRLPRRKGVLR